MVQFVKHRLQKWRKSFPTLLVGGGVVVSVLLALWLVFIFIKIPSIENFEEREVAQSTKIYDHTGETLLWEIHGDEKRTVIPFEEISRHIRNATIAIEDSNFYSHGGVSVTSLVRVLFLNAFRGQRIGSGGSTITQQLVKNTLLTPEQTPTRKMKEIIIAIKLESTYSKDEVLNLYLNEIPYGSNAYGVEVASQNFFGKSARDVTLAEAAYLAALPKAPTFYSPYGNNRDALEERKNLVLQRMKDLSFITQEEYDQARDEKVTFQAQRKQGLLAPHFVIYVREILNERYGEDIVERGGLQVTTTLDLDLQQKAEEILTRQVETNAKNYRSTNAGLVAIDPKTGRIVSMVGSRDYFDIEHDGNYNVTLAKRQPGSAFKPIVYATAFKKGYTPDTVVFDLPTNFSTNPNQPYTPSNYDGRTRGPLTLRSALAQSLNIPAVKVLYLAGLSSAIDTAQDFGISTLNDRSRFGLSLVLGGGEVMPLELTAAYGVFATGGIKNETHAILEVKDSEGNILERENIRSERVIDENVAHMVTDILSDNQARTPIFGANSRLYFENYDVAAKTGTSNDFRDGWTLGYSPNIVVGTWGGNNDNSPMRENIDGITIVGPIWREFMLYALSKQEKESFIEPSVPRPEKPVLRGMWQGSRSYMIDSRTGQFATDDTPDEFREERIAREVHSILYWVQKDDPNGDIPSNPEQDSQFRLWEGPVRAWASRNGFVDQNINIPPGSSPSPPSPESDLEINLAANEENKTFRGGEIIMFHPTISGRAEISAVEIFVDSQFIKSEIGSPSIITLGNVSAGDHTLTLKAYDTTGAKQEKSFSFTYEGL